MNRRFALLLLVLIPVLFLFIACEPQEQHQYSLSVSVQGEGSVYPSSGFYPLGHMVTFALNPHAGWQFERWEGRDSQQVVTNKDRYEILMDRDMHLIAVFSGSSQKEHNLNVSVQGGGTVYPNFGKFEDGKVLTFDIRAEEGWVFSHWEGTSCWDVVQEGSLWKLTMDGPKDLLAVFYETSNNNYKLDISIQGRGRVERQIISEAEANEEYPLGTSLILTAKADPGWNFKEWLGDVRGTAPIVNINMDSDKFILAIFEETERKLTINVVGKGTVGEKLMSDLEGQKNYPSHSIVRLFAKADSGWLFKEWQGDARGSEPVITIEMDQDKHVTAVFIQTTKTLDITIIGKGKVEQRLVASQEEYPVDSAIRLWARPDNGWSFKEWRGDARGTNPVIYVDLDTDKQITAVFEASSYYLDIEIIGNGQVDERLLSDEYPDGSVVRLTARADSGWIFKEWRGDARGTKETVEIEISGDMYVTAVFEKEETTKYKLDVNISGNGQVSKNPDSTSYEPGTRVNLTASADNGWAFKEWLGDASGANQQISLTMDSHKEVTAVFEKQASGGTAQVSGSLKLTHTWPYTYASSNSLSTPREDIGKIPVLHSLGIQDTLIDRPQYVEGQLIVGFDEVRLMEVESQVSILEAAGLEILQSIPEVNAHLVKAPVEELAMHEEMDRLGKLTGVAYVEPNYIAYACSMSTANTKVPNDPYYGRQWHYKQIRLPHAWAVTTGSKSVRVAVLDTGVNHSHVDLKGQVDTASGWNFNGNNSNASDRQGHGTHCAGTIAAATNNGVGVAGVMWEATIIPVKVLGDNGSGSFTDITNGILYAAGALSSRPLNNPAHVISMSLGGSSGSTTLQNACKQAASRGVLVIAASGNENGAIIYPARYDEVIAVGSTNYNYPNRPGRARYSNYGPQLDIMAPGGDTSVDTDRDGNKDGVLSTTGSGYQYFQGTSMACPHAAGVAGLMLANGIPASQVKTILRRTAMDLGGGDFSNQFGYGLVNTYWAVNDVKDIRIVVGTKNGNGINIVAEGKVDLRSKQYTLSNIPSGEYQVFGWIDVQGTNTIDSGDYLFESSKMRFTDGQKATVNMELKEIK